MLITPAMYDLITVERARKSRHVRREAERQVREKFPNLMEGTPGYVRAVANRINRLKRKRT